MLSTRKVSPGQKGTRKLHAQYGDRLPCVRYRYDPQQQKRLKAIELMIEEAPWPPPPAPFAASAIVGVRVAFEEIELQRRIKQAGGKWNPARRVREMRYDQAMTLGLEDRIEELKVSTNRHQGGIY
jgi:hypothetical protein